MKRNIESFDDQQFEAVVVGGGIHGATVFHQLAKIGMRVVLIDKGDFGQATSASSLKILHSGLQDLHQLNFKGVCESINSRHQYMEIAPHLITPLPYLMPTRGLGMQSKPVMTVVLKLFDWIRRRKKANRLTETSSKKGQILSKKECFTIAPGINPQALTGAAVWYEDLIHNTERMTLSFVQEGCDKYGGVAANYVRAEEIIKDGDQIIGVQTTDTLNGKPHLIKASLVINAAGSWAGEIASPGKISSTPEDLAKAVSIVINKALFAPYAMELADNNDVPQGIAIKRKNHYFTLVPWKNKTIIGATYKYYRDTSDTMRVTEKDIQELLDEINRLYPILKLKKSDVVFSNCGLVPAHKGSNYNQNTTPQLLEHSRIIDHEEEDNIKGLFTIEGVSYTTAPEIARQLVELMDKKGIGAERLVEKVSPVEKNNSTPYSEDKLASLNEQYQEIYANHGSKSAIIYRLMDTTPEGNKTFMKEPVVTKAEILYAVREEMAVKLVDVVLRRTCAATSCCPDRVSLNAIAEVMAEELSWDRKHIQSEVDEAYTCLEHIFGTSAANDQ